MTSINIFLVYSYAFPDLQIKYLFSAVSSILSLISIKANIRANAYFQGETFEKCSILPAQLNPSLIFNRGSMPRKVK